MLVIHPAALDLPHALVEWATLLIVTRAVQTAHRTLRSHIEVENAETALEIAARGHADTIAARGVVHRLTGRLPHRLRSAPLRPRLYGHFATVHSRNITLSRVTRTLIDLATTRLRQATARGRQADPRGAPDAPSLGQGGEPDYGFASFCISEE